MSWLHRTPIRTRSLFVSGLPHKNGPDPAVSGFQAVLSRLTDWKDHVPFLALGVAVVYGVGWVVQTCTYAQLGVGIVPVARETAMASVLALTWFLIPTLLIAGMLGDLLRPNSARQPKELLAGLLGSLVVYIVSVVLIVYLPLHLLLASQVGSSASAASIVVTQGLLPLVLFLTCLISGKQRFYGRGFVLLNLILGAGVFVTSVLPHLPPAAGGLGGGRVIVKLKEPEETIRGVLKVADDRVIILSDASRGNDSNRVPALRVPASRLVEMTPDATAVASQRP